MVNNRINPDDVPPRRNLPDEAEQWGRWMEDDQNLLKGAVISQGQSLQGLNRSTAASLANISDQLTAIADAQAELQAQQVILSEQQTILSEQQSDLSDAQSDITDLLGRVVTSRVATNTASNFPVTTSFQTRVSTSISVPSGYNRVAITATLSMAARVATSPPNDYLYGAIRIAGVQSDEIFAQGSWNSSSGHYPNVTTSFSRVINNPSGSLSIEGRAKTEVTNWASNAGNRAVITATATFYNE